VLIEINRLAFHSKECGNYPCLCNFNQTGQTQACVTSPACAGWGGAAGAASLANFTRFFLKNCEHTWGVSVQHFKGKEGPRIQYNEAVYTFKPSPYDTPGLFDIF
jgi:hypothetical protein